MKITKKALESMVRETLENRLAENPAAVSIPGKAQSILRQPKTQSAFDQLEAVINQEGMSEQIKANIFTAILRMLGMDTPEELDAMRNKLKGALGKAAKSDPEAGAEVAADSVATADVTSDTSGMSSDDLKMEATNLMRNLIRKELKAAVRK